MSTARRNPMLCLHTELARLGKRVWDRGIADTTQIVLEGKMLEIEVLDHLVIGERKLGFK